MSNNISRSRLDEMCSIKGRIGFRGYTSNDIVAQGNGAISLSPGDIKNHTLICEKPTYITWGKYYESPEIMVEVGDILFCKTGSTIGKVAYVDDLLEKATINPQLVIMKDIKCNRKYLKYYLSTDAFQREIQNKKGIGSIPSISQKELGAMEVIVPSIAVQERIVNILDKFDKLCNDISEGLPAEIELNRKRYEYYRNKLLDFKECQ